MKRHLWPLGLMAALSMLGPAAPARAQLVKEPTLPKASEKKDNRPPVPPGVPTNAENVHLPTEGEVILGRDGSAEVEKVYKVLTSGPYVDRVQRVAREVVRAIHRPAIAAEYRRVYRPKADDKGLRVPFEYTIKVIDDEKLVNAFSLAGGPIYVTRGLLDFTPSDDELASVLAHECAHVAYHHVVQVVKKEKKLTSRQLWALLATVVAGAAGGGAIASSAGTALMGAQLVTQAMMSGYGRELEHEADRIGVMALAGTQYNPLGMLTFMQKLARGDRLRGNPDYGIYQSHPFSNERATTLRKQLEELGYRTDPGSLRQVNGAFLVTTAPVLANNAPAVELRLNGNVLFVVAAGEEGLTPSERAYRMARRLEELFQNNLSYNDIRRSPDKTTLMLKGVPVIHAYPEDAAAAGSAEAATERAMNEISRALLKEQLQNG